MQGRFLKDVRILREFPAVVQKMLHFCGTVFPAQKLRLNHNTSRSTVLE